MGKPFRTSRRVEFRDTDAAGIVHFSVFFNYLEQAEHELLRQIGLSVLSHDSEGEVGWPRVAAKFDYRLPARFEDVLDVVVTVARVGRSSVTYRGEFLLRGKLIATGETTAVYCRHDAQRNPSSLPIPDDVRARLNKFSATAAE
jgi:4-hydroxybenzoyl-CoA thioesterase/acyl-CoA thioester hydrolase